MSRPEVNGESIYLLLLANILSECVLCLMVGLSFLSILISTSLKLIVLVENSRQSNLGLLENLRNIAIMEATLQIDLNDRCVLLSLQTRVDDFLGEIGL